MAPPRSRQPQLSDDATPDADAIRSMLGAGVMEPTSFDGAAVGVESNASEAASDAASEAASNAAHGIAPPRPRTLTIPSRTRLAILLAALAMLGPFSIDTYLPAFPEIERSLDASAIQVQQTMTAYLLAFAVMILWHGALSDALGRRIVILVSLVVFVVASFGCASAHSIQYLWAFRVLQGLSAGAGIVVGRAIVRDLYAGPEAEKLLSLVTMIFAIAPAIAPILGGWVVEAFDWRTIFLGLFVYSFLLLWASFRLLPETLPIAQRQPFNAESLWHSYKSVFGTLRFHAYAGTVAFNFVGLFLYVAAAPVFIIEHLHLSEREFGWFFIPSVSGIFLGALIANRTAGRWKIGKQVRTGFYLMGSASLVNLAYHLAFPPAVPWSVLPVFFYTIGMSITAPGVTLMVLDLFPTHRGVAASCQSFLQTMLGAIAAGMLAPALSASALWLALGQVVCVFTALGCWRIGRSRRITGPRTA
jgi:DHA1 family bicyclomycin/chloramphenicol resistance-like MFS transporter